MKVENFRTQEFKNKVNHIANSRLNGLKLHELKYNFDFKGNTKPIRVCGVAYEDCVAIFKTSETIGRVRKIMPQAITANDILMLERTLKINKIGGNEVIIQSARKIKPSKPAIIDLIIGEYYGLGSNCLIQIISRTEKQAKYQIIDCVITNQEVKERFEESKSRYGGGYYKNLDIKTELKAYGPTLDGKVHVIRLNKDGYWFSGRDYNYRSVRKYYTVEDRCID